MIIWANSCYHHQQNNFALLMFSLKLQLQMQASGIEMCASKHDVMENIKINAKSAVFCRIEITATMQLSKTFRNQQNYCKRFLCSPLACQQQLLHLAIIPLPRNKSGREQGILQNCRSSRTIDLHLKRPKGIRTMPRITLNSVRSVQH